MTLGEMKKRCLQLAFRYSRKGEVLEDGNPGKKEYLLMLPALIDAAQKELAASAGKLRAAFAVSHFPPENLLRIRGEELFPGSCVPVRHRDSRRLAWRWRPQTREALWRCGFAGTTRFICSSSPCMQRHLRRSGRRPTARIRSTACRRIACAWNRTGFG